MNNAESNAVLADGTTVCENTITDFPVVLRDMKNLKEVSCFFKVNIDPLLKQQVKDAYPNIKIK